ncbi:hypothetical protein RRF57_006346 [Xylaria bambusicola]|uniref:Proline dehydrogenase n=1 Tax=Xylaria bambusicola TaxID=326684 RepID=A0AAN7UQ40_9PEZI
MGVVKAPYNNNIVSLNVVTATIISRRLHLPRAWTPATHLYHSKRILAPSNISNRNSLEFQTSEKSNSAPLAILPISILLRSLFISNVISKPYLLNPSLSILSFLSQPVKISLLSIDSNPFLRWLVKRLLYNQFCTGENAADVKKTMNQMHKFGFLGVILRYAKETTSDHKTKKSEVPGSPLQQTHTAEKGKCVEIESWRAGTLRTVYMTSNGDKVALKLTGAGPIVTAALATGDLPPKHMLDALDEICLAVRETKAQIIVDAELQRFQKGIARTAVMLMRKYNTEKSPLVTQTYQCYLKNKRSYLWKSLAKASKEGWSIGVKLVRGAYIVTEERSRIHDTKEDTDNAYYGLVRDVLRHNGGSFGGLGKLGNTPFPKSAVLLATHNRNSVMKAHKLHQ